MLSMNWYLLFSVVAMRQRIVNVVPSLPRCQRYECAVSVCWYCLAGDERKINWKWCARERVRDDEDVNCESPNFIFMSPCDHFQQRLDQWLCTTAKAISSFAVSFLPRRPFISRCTATRLIICIDSIRFNWFLLRCLFARAHCYWRCCVHSAAQFSPPLITIYVRSIARQTVDFFLPSLSLFLTLARLFVTLAWRTRSFSQIQ